MEIIGSTLIRNVMDLITLQLRSYSITLIPGGNIGGTMPILTSHLISSKIKSYILGSC